MSAPPPLRRQNRTTRIIVVLVSVPAITLVAIFAIMHWRLSVAVSSHRAAFRNAGRPMTINDCLKEYRAGVSSPENASSAYDEAFRLLTNTARLDFVFPPSARRTLPHWDEDQRKMAAQLLRENAGALSHVDACLKHPRAYRALEWDAGAAMLLRHLVSLKQLLELLEIHALSAIRDQETATALADIDRLIRAADSVADEPLLVDVSTRERFHIVACRLMREMLSTKQLDEEQLVTMASLTAKMSLQTHLMRAIDFERVASVKVFEGSNHDIQEYLTFLYQNQEFVRVHTPFDIVYMRFSGALKRDYLFYLVCIRNITAAAVMTGSQRIEVAAPVAEAISREKWLTGERTASIWTKAHANFLSETYLPDVISVLNKIVRHDAEVALTSDAIAAARYQKRTGAWPKSLHELEAQPFGVSAINPGNGARFSITATNNTFTITAEQQHIIRYSVQTRENSEPLSVTLTADR